MEGMCEKPPGPGGCDCPDPVLGPQWASPGLTVSSLFKRHVVCEKSPLAPEMWFERLILCRAGAKGLHHGHQGEMRGV